MKFDCTPIGSNLVKLSTEVNIDPHWIDFCMVGDIFKRSYCGYWLKAWDYNDELGSWLCWEHDDRLEPDNDEEAVNAWKNEKPLPNGWHILNKNIVVKAYLCGVLSRGIDWIERADAWIYDEVIQLALLGDLKYG